LTALAKTLRSANDDQSLRAVMLSGRGKHFCTGADLKWMKDAGALEESANLQEAGLLTDLYESIAQCEVPFIVRAHGSVRGGGMGLVAACDIAVCETQTTFALPEAARGLVPGVLTPFVLRKIGYSPFLDLALTGRPLDAHGALKHGLIQFHGNQDEVADYLQGFVSRLNQTDSATLRAIKKSAQRFTPYSRVDLEAMAALTANHRATDIAQTRIAAFLEKRK
jgi:methylglutaconyl-CoA hydratase